ncbi:glutathione S-transferase family protein [Leptothoe spongobia]|uniref:Glutathione S-transferase family protein n=1 Tax=Leptothoe spongobia TAU-MAC 1115 TaxID=1967444 RepID=A0A947DFK8_9CYAN|nr:glutathione S-transferase family protein [Leptothoe spongobia]MBT9316010.1 glutathione S-transferase family protein [Leptothoe spongobia TAU-MAC 1115]
MITLYHTPLSINSRRVWVALIEKGLEFELKEINLTGDQFKPEFLALNPFHHIPVLVDGDHTIIESFAMLDYLEAKYPRPALMPTQPEAVVRVRMVQMVTLNEMLPATMPLTMKHLFGKDDPDAVKQAYEKAAVVFKFWAQQLGDDQFFGGPQLSLADVVSGTMAAWFPEMGLSLADYPTLAAWRQRLMERPAWQQTHVSQAALDDFKERMRSRMGGQ